MDEDVVVPAKHEGFKTARVRNFTLSILELNMNPSGKGVLKTRVMVQPEEQKVPIQIINPGVSPIHKGMTAGQLRQIDELSDPAFIDSAGDLLILTIGLDLS